LTPIGLKLVVPAKPENLAVIRQAVAGLAEAVGFDDAAISDIKTIVTEAGMNAVVHAYAEGEGPLEVTAEPVDDGLEIAVRDRGEGFQPRPADPDSPGLRLGLPLIAALSDGFQIHGARGKGTEIRMRVNLEHPREEDIAADLTEPAAGTVMSIAAGHLVRPVLARVISALAARADFSIDRLSDTVLIGDAVSAHNPADFRDGAVGIEILDADGRLQVQVGPLVSGGSERLIEELDVPGGGSLRNLASDVSVEHRDANGGGEPAAGPGEFLVLEIERDHRRG
jgi:serine/threonine-protein kinase RsbW